MNEELIERLRQRIHTRRGMNGGRIDSDTKDMQESIAAIDVITAERDALAAELKALREQKPVARIDDDENFQGPCRHAMAFVPMHRGAPLYARPVPARELTDADIALCIASADKSFAQERISGKPVLGVWSKHLARAIERYLKGESE